MNYAFHILTFVLVSIVVFIPFYFLYLWKPYVPLLISCIFIYAFNFTAFFIFTVIFIVPWALLNLLGAVYWSELRNRKVGTDYYWALLALLPIENIGFTGSMILVYKHFPIEIADSSQASLFQSLLPVFIPALVVNFALFLMWRRMNPKNSSIIEAEEIAGSPS